VKLCRTRGALPGPAGGAGTPLLVRPKLHYDLDRTDGATHRVGLYALDWTTWSQPAREIIDAASGRGARCPQLANFAQGQYLAWDLRGTCRSASPTSGPFNAVVSGLFFDPAMAAHRDGARGSGA